MKKAKIELNLENLAYNFEKIREITGHGVNAIPVVKANAYDIGIYNVVDRLLRLDIPQTKYFVFALKEGIELRKMFPKLERIFVLNSIFDGDEKFFEQYSLTPVINNFEQLKLVSKTSIKDVVLQFNTGLNRNGFEVSQTKSVKEYIEKYYSDKVIGLDGKRASISFVSGLNNKIVSKDIYSEIIEDRAITTEKKIQKLKEC